MMVKKLQLSDALLVVGVISAPLGYFLFPSVPNAVIVGILFSVVLVFWGYSKYVQRQVATPRVKPIPPPSIFWRTFNFQLPARSDAPHKVGTPLKITIVHDAASTET